jgi:hypothetical protein
MAESDPHLVVPISDADILSRLCNSEDNFVERKPNGDKAGWLRSAVAFANSAPIGYPAVLFVGVDNSGVPQQNGNLEELQKTVSKEINRAFPPIYYTAKAMEKHGKTFLAIIVPGSTLRPHFAGKSYIRVGPETKEASQELLDILVSERLSLVYEIRKYIGRKVRLLVKTTLSGTDVRLQELNASVLDCNAFYITTNTSTARTLSYPLQDLKLSYDHSLKTLQIEIAIER